MTDAEKLAKLAEAIGFIHPITVHNIHRVPPYLTSADAALTLVDALAKDGWHWILSDNDNGALVTFWDDQDPTRSFTCHAPTLPTAICEAFAKVKGLW